jgi:hypothetical protein
MYTIETELDGHTVTAEAIPTPNGVNVLSWIES